MTQKTLQQAVIDRLRITENVIERRPRMRDNTWYGHIAVRNDLRQILQEAGLNADELLREDFDADSKINT